MKRSTTALLLTLAVTACEAPPTETQPLEGAYLLDRVNGSVLPGQICHEDAIDQVLLFESIAMHEAGTYGRLQRLRFGDEDYVEQQEVGDFVRTDSTFLLINAAEDTLVLVMLDEEAARLRRIHPCGDTLRYSQARVEA